MSETPVFQARNDALRRFRDAVEFGGCSRGDLLGSPVRRPVVDVFADPATASRVFGLRGTDAQGRWSQLVRGAAESPTSLGFVHADGTVGDLVGRFGGGRDVFLRNLRTWGAKRPPIVVSAERKDRKKTAIVQVPLLSAWLLWIADARSVTYRGMQGFIGAERIRQVAVSLIVNGKMPPPEKALLPVDADRLIRLASSR
ncbi:MAG TPA: hypothetical protein DF783_02915 [Acidimicrobiaceae bacterium]|nr:hypothetical protein [Acidimicrobiaceae bacterium]HCV35850.1 hypothetical protein [Acidimicrobiaceae bacterium]HJO79101.1 hypothetical protein [Acidimicrobiales bacterium]